MKTAIEYQPTLAFGLLLQGPPKTGKSILCTQFPGVGIIDADNNMGGPIRWLRKYKPDKTDVFIETINMADTDLSIDHVPQSGTLKVAKGSEVPDHARWANLVRAMNMFLGNPNIKTIAIDGLSSVAQYIIDHIVADKGSGKKEGMTISDWQPFRNMLSKLIINTRAKGRLVVMTCHEEINKDETSGTMVVTPNVPSKLAGNIAGFFSDVWRTESELSRDGTGKEVITYKVRCAPRGTIPSLGNSLGLPMEFVFTWEGFAKILYA